MNISLFKSKTIRLALLGFLFLSIFVALVALRERILRPKATGGPVILSFSATPSPLQEGSDFDLILKANPNGLSFNAFEFHFTFEDSKVGLRNADDFAVNFEELFTSGLGLRHRVEGNKIIVFDAKTGKPFTGANDIDLVKVKMKVKQGATGQANFIWNQATEVEDKPLEKQDGSFSIQPPPPTITPTATVTVTPTVTITPTPSPYWYSFGPLGAPTPNWDTAEELLDFLTSLSKEALEIDLYNNATGSWVGHPKDVPFANFPIKTGEGYVIKFARDPVSLDGLGLDGLPVPSLTYNLGLGMNLISIPKNLLEALNQGKMPIYINSESLCQFINNQGGSVVEIATLTDHNGTGEPNWTAYTCGSKGQFEILAGRSYFVKVSQPTAFTIPYINPTLTPTPTPCPGVTCDVNSDSQETVDDYNLITSCWHQPLDCCLRCNFDCDGDIDVIDIQQFANKCYYLISTPTPTSTPIPTSSPQAAKLKFKVKLPDVAASVTTIPADKVKLVLLVLPDGTNSLTRNSELIREGDYYKTSEISVEIVQTTTYKVFIKQEASLQKAFKSVVLTPDKTLDCTEGSSTDCAELITQLDSKPLLSGDSDGFNTNSDSYNKIDIADFQRYVAERTGAATTTTADFNLDGQVNTIDLGILARNFGLVGD